MSTEKEFTPEREPTPEEIQEMRTRMLFHYDQQIPFLERQKEYETLLMDIEIARAKRIEATIRIAQMTMGPYQEEDDQKGSDADIDDKTQKRNLKKKQ